MIDVFEQIKDLLVFESKDDFYYLQVLQRKKENPDIGSNSRVIKNYYINSIDYLEKKYPEIKALCEQFNARAMLRLNKRSYKKVASKTIEKMLAMVLDENYFFVSRLYDKSCGKGHSDKRKKWILDMDGEYNEEFIQEVIDFLEKCHPEGDKLILGLPTKNGLHLIVKPFNKKDFYEKYPNITIHKDNPINLYIP